MMNASVKLREHALFIYLLINFIYLFITTEQAALSVSAD